ncbi:uncharacterized protein LOC105695424 [Orussus abietinus]|uniref:uncharacterized protein LOC105695424 n=1 Tax=Orussus abietinus TaxID=222816 RepID=UPI0006252B8A|nr:uncharacterized protein LOC105695424 [Orussus abietinus]
MGAKHFLLLQALICLFCIMGPETSAAKIKSFNPGVPSDSHWTASNVKTIEIEPEAEVPRKVMADLLRKDQFFQDIFFEHSAPFKVQFGHVCENPKEWEQRFERRDFELNHHQGKVLWGDKDGAYGEHYWDLNHGKGR